MRWNILPFKMMYVMNIPYATWDLEACLLTTLGFICPRSSSMLLLESRLCSMIHNKIQAWTQHCRLIGTKYIKVNNSKNWEQYKSKLQSFSTELKFLVLPVNTDVVLYRVDRNTVC